MIMRDVSPKTKLNYEGFQAKDWIDGLLSEKGVMQIDLARMIGVSPKTVSFWVTGVSFPNPMAAKSLIQALAPGHQFEGERKQFIDENTSIYESIRKAYLKTSQRYNDMRKVSNK